MKQFISFIRKEFYHILRDKRSLLILLGMPIAQIILFGYAISSDVRNVKVALFNPSADFDSHQLVDKIEASEYFIITQKVGSLEDINTLFQEGEIDLAIVFPSDFSDQLHHHNRGDIQVIVDATDPNMGTTYSTYLSAIVADYQQSRLEAKQPPIQITPVMKLLYNPQMKSAYNFVPGVMGLILMLICAMMTSVSIVREKERGTMEILLVSPMRPVWVIIAKAVPYFVLSCINLLTILLLSVLVLDVPIMGSLFWLLTISFIFILASLALGLMVSNIADTQVAAMLISGMGFLLPTMMLSGMLFPIESMPPFLQAISQIIPARWYISAVRKVMIQGVDVFFVWREIAVLTGMALLFIGVSLKMFNNRLQ